MSPLVLALNHQNT
jgi:hypothetical protein